MTNKKLHLVSLGCARNLVDSEIMMGRLANAGWTITQEPAEADVIIINTCSFIEDAANESIDTILELAKFKQHGSCRNLIVAGCLPERYREEIIHALPEVDIFLGTGAFDKIAQAAESPGNQQQATSNKQQATSKPFPKCLLPAPDSVIPAKEDEPRIRSFSHTAYVKIAEGCGKHCTYCIIPKLRGKQKSRLPENIVAEARSLVESGVKELILVAQDTTSYGTDLAQDTGLAQLLENISDISDDIWIRVLYGHPKSIDESVIRTVTERHNICSYFDIPIQHASSAVLKKMGRGYTREDLYRLFDKILSQDSEISLRTTIMVGFPGETDKDFEELSDFAEDLRFDHLGIFTYSDSEDLPSHKLSDHVPKHVAKKRYDWLMSRQMEISFENNQEKIGRVLKVLVEESPEPNLFTGRTCFQAPEVDGITYIHLAKLEISKESELILQTRCFADIQITDALEYDLIGKCRLPDK